MPNQYINKVVYGGSPLIDLTDTTATASDVASGKWFYLASGERVQGAASVGGADVPIISADELGTTLTCSMTYADCYDYAGYNSAAYLSVEGDGYTMYSSLSMLPRSSDYGDPLSFVLVDNGVPVAQFDYASDGTITPTAPSTVGTLTVTANDTYYAPYDMMWNEVEVNVPSGGGNDFIVTLGYDGTIDFAPDCTYAELLDAYDHDKNIVFSAGGGSCSWSYTPAGFEYSVYIMTNDGTHDSVICVNHLFTSNGVTVLGYTEYPDTTIATAVAADVASGKTFFNGSGIQTGTYVTPTARTSSDVTVSGDTVTVPAGAYSSQVTKSVASGTAGTPTATKGAVSNHAVSVTPSVTNTTGYITGGTKTGTAVSVSASELVSGTLSITGSGTADVTNYASASVAAGSASAPSTISGTSATVSTGTNTLTLSKTVSVTPTVSAGYVSSGTATNSAVSLTASVTTQAAQTIYPSATDQSIAASRYLTGAQTIKAVTTSNLTAENIKSGVTVTVGDSSDADRVLSVTGTYSGGGGGVGTLLTTYSMGTISTSSTQAADTGKSISVSGVDNYDLLIVETSVNTVTNNRHTATVGLVFLTASSTVGTKNGAAIATMKWNSKISNQGVTTTRQGTTAYGIYPNSCSVATSNNVTTATIPMYQRYNSTSTGTINGTYTTRVYGVNLYDLIGG